MASFRLGPLRSPNNRLLNQQQTQEPVTPPFSIDPSQLQVSLEQTQGPPTTPQSNRSPGKSSPLRGRCVKEYEEQLQQLQHENFNLKLRVFLLEERVGKALGRDAADIIKNNIELKVENETLKKSLTDKCQLLTQASGAIEDLENQQRSALASHQAEILALKEQIDDLQKELVEAEEARLLSNRHPDESADLYAQAFGSFVLNGQQQPTCNYPDHHSQDDVNELQARIDELTSQLVAQAEEMNKLSSSVNKSEEILEYRQRVKHLEADVNQHQLRISQLEEDRSAKEAKINELMREQDKDGRAVEKDKIIEEKQCQLEQQNKILVEIQITLDEKQKQIQELEGALNDRRKKVEELEKSLTKAGRTLQGFVTDIQKKEKELELLRGEGRKKDKRVKDLTAELKEAQEMLNKAKWEAETGTREDGVKAMAEEENERLWAELEEKKRQLSAAEHQKAMLQHEVNQLASLRQAVGQKEQAVLEAETQIATLKRQVAELQTEVANRSRLSMEKAQHSTLERKELVATIQHQYEEAQSKVERLEKELQRLKAWKKKTEGVAADAAGGDQLLRMYKKEVTVLRKRLADSTNACDILRNRLEEMADFLEEILSMSQQDLINLSNWSATTSGDKRRQALQNSIMQSRELSRSLSASLMIGVEQPESPVPLEEEDQPLRTHSSSSVASTSAGSSSWSLHSGNERSWSDRQPLALPPPSELDLPDASRVLSAPTTLAVPQGTLTETSQQAVVYQLRIIVAQLEEQVKQRDVEIAWMNMERENNNRKNAALNKSIQTEVDNKNMVSSTPFHPVMGPQGVPHSFLSPVPLGTVRDGSQSASLTRALTLSQLVDTMKKTPESTPGHPGYTNASESEAWSEPDRTVSFARMGLPAHHEVHNSIAALLSKKSRNHSTTRDADSSDSDSSADSSKGTVRRSRPDQNEGKRSGKRLRAVEQENAHLRSQLAEVIDNLRSTYDAQLIKDDSMLLDDSQNKEDSNHSTEGSMTSGDVTATARYIIEALQGRLIKTKELVRKREQRLRETKDLAAQLELKLKEKNIQNCEMELQLKEAREKLAELDGRWTEVQSILATKERLTIELQGALDARETELRSALMKAQLWEDSYQASQKNSRQKEADLLTQQELLVQSKTMLEQQVRLFSEELEALKQEKDLLQSNLESVKVQLQKAEMVAQSRRSSQGIQRQFSQMSDYVSDQAVSAEDAPPAIQGKVSEQVTASPRPSTLHLSPDLGIDSDPGRFSSLEHSTVEQKENLQTNNKTWAGDKQSKSSPSPKKAEEKHPDVLGLTPNCPNCPRWQNKYAKAKQTLAATLEKLQAANLRKEKVDRALNKELGKTHNILCQARGILEQANQAGH